MKKPSAPARQTTGPNDKEIFGTWIDGYNAGDVEQVMSIFDASVRYFAPCQPQQTYDTLIAWFRNDFKRSGPRPSWTFQTESIDVGDELAVIVSRWTAVTYLEGFSADLHRLRSIDVLRFGTEGWKIIRTINDPQCCGEAPLSVAKPSRKPRR
jgi:hypothetical protein